MKLAHFALTLCLLISTNSALGAQKIDGMYVNTFGKPGDQALIFVHGGPGHNSWDFELTTAPVLANLGYYVIVYDERGQGRSDEAQEKDFSYKKYADDLKLIIDTLKISAPVILGHSHGGPIAIRFQQEYPEVAKKIVLVSATINLWGSLESLFSNCATRFKDTGNTEKLAKLTKAYYNVAISPHPDQDFYAESVAEAFALGAECGIYMPKNPTPEALALWKKLFANPLPGPLSGLETAVPGFLENDDYIHFNEVNYVSGNSTHFCGIYGDQDGLFNALELSLIEQTLKLENDSPAAFTLVKGASHSIFIDQQATFIETLKSCLKS
jgi:proline iminopeptidase